ncbi:MAG: GntR family transcriptional regulator [Desulfobacterales bacterium]
MALKQFEVGQPLEPYRSIADQIYENLKNCIINGEIKPGDRLFEAELARTFQASRTPVREAFRRLEQDHLIERLAQGGVKIPTINRETIEDLYNLRAVLEAYALELACDRVAPEQISTLKQIRAQALELLKSSESKRDYVLKRLLELNSLFHETIYQATGSKFLIKVIGNLRAIVMGMRARSIQADRTWQQVWDEHSRLIGHLERGEKENAVQLIREHVAHAAAQAFSVIQMQAGDPAHTEAEPALQEARNKAR